MIVRIAADCEQINYQTFANLVPAIIFYHRDILEYKSRKLYVQLISLYVIDTYHI